MTTKLIDHLKKGNVAGIKESVHAILQDKVLDKIEEMRQEILEQQGSEEIRDFFQLIGAEEYEETDTTISAVFPNKSTLQYALDQLPDDLEFDIFYWDNLETVDADIPWYPEDEADDDGNPIETIDFDDLTDSNENGAYELVIYKLDDFDHEPPTEMAEEDVQLFGSMINEGTDKFTDDQLKKLHAEYSKIKTVNPDSQYVKNLRTFVKGMTPAQKKQIRDAQIPFLRTMAMESFDWFNSNFSKAAADKHFQKFNAGKGETLWTSDSGVNYWMNSDSGEVVKAKEKAKPEGAREYSGNHLKPIKEMWCGLNEGYIGDATDKMIDNLFKGKFGGELSAAYNDENKEAVNVVLRKYKTKQIDINKIMNKMFGARSTLANMKVESVNEANENEGGRMIKRRVSFAKKKRGGKLVNRRQRRRKGKVSQGAGKGYKAKGAGWKTKLIQSNRKRKISKRKNVKAQKVGKRFAARSRNIRKKLGFKSGT